VHERLWLHPSVIYIKNSCSKAQGILLVLIKLRSIISNSGVGPRRCTRDRSEFD
jgi:hypothetical protein